MAPVNPGECAARGLALELAFDATIEASLTFVDEAQNLLDRKRAEGSILPGWFSLRYVGPARAILSPQQAGRTCMVEFVGLRAMTGTAPILDELEKLGKVYGAIQHWGMFGVGNLVADDLPRAYPRLETWRRVRRGISDGGAIRTFENEFSTRVGLDAAPGDAPLVQQQDWRWCSKCLGMAFGGGAAGACPAGGAHNHAASGNYSVAHNAPWLPGQRRWRWCSKCQGMTLEGPLAAPCPGGGAHDLSGSGEYTMVRNGQSDWRWCRNCQCLAFGGAAAAGTCPAGGTHDHTGSGSYWLAFAPLVQAEVLIGWGPPGGDPVEQAASSTEVPGERGWRWCSRAKDLARRRTLLRRRGACARWISRLHRSRERADSPWSGALASLPQMPDARVPRRQMFRRRPTRPRGQRGLHRARECRAARVALLQELSRTLVQWQWGTGPVRSTRRRPRSG